jgi:hypothetical protein
MSAGRKVFSYSGTPITGIPRGTALSVLNTSYTVTADIEVPQSSGRGQSRQSARDDRLDVCTA